MRPLGHSHTGTGNIRHRRFLIVALLLLSIPAYAPTALSQATNATANGNAHVYLFRGLVDFMSFGVDRFARELRAEGFGTSVHPTFGGAGVARRIEREWRDSRNHGPVLLYGYSTGANTAIGVAKRLQRSGIPVDLLATVDPFPIASLRVPSNVRSCANYYHSFVPGIPLLGARPVSKEKGGRTQLTNTDLWRSKLRKGFVQHFNMDEQPRVKAEILSRLLEVFAPATRLTATRPNRQAF